MPRVFRTLFLFALAASASAQSLTVLRYAHMNPPESIPGRQAVFFARKVEEYSRGAIRIEVHPSSALGTLDKQLDLASRGIIAFHHNTAAAFGSLADGFSALDTPYLYRDVEHLMRTAAPDSPVMAVLGDELRSRAGLRVLYTFYFGTRQLSCDRPIYRPIDLSGVKIRAIPFPLYEAAVAALGAVAVPIDWSFTPAALASKAVNGQENPVDTILTSRLYESQRYLMLTGHIRAADIVVVNDAVWTRLPRASQAAISKAAADAAAYGTELTVRQEASDLKELERLGMMVIDAGKGLRIEEFERKAKEELRVRFSDRWEGLYRLIDALR